LIRNRLAKRIDLLHQVPILLLQFAILLDQLIDGIQNVSRLLGLCLRGGVSGLSAQQLGSLGRHPQKENIM